MGYIIAENKIIVCVSYYAGHEGREHRPVSRVGVRGGRYCPVPTIYHRTERLKLDSAPVGAISGIKAMKQQGSCSIAALNEFTACPDARDRSRWRRPVLHEAITITDG